MSPRPMGQDGKGSDTGGKERITSPAQPELCSCDLSFIEIIISGGEEGGGGGEGREEGEKGGGKGEEGG